MGRDSVEPVTQQRTFTRIAGLILLFLGVLLGALYVGAAAWGDWEALQFDTLVAFRSEKGLSTLRCPVLMTTGETGTVHVTVRNPTDRQITRTVRAYISAGDVMAKREFMERVVLGPGESRRLSWEILPQDRVFDLFVLVRVYLSRSYRLPSEDAACGVLVLDLPSWRGGVLVSLVVAASLLCMGAGTVLSRRGLHRASERVRWLVRNGTAMAAIVVAAIAAGFLGWLWLETITLILLFLLVIITAGQAVYSA